MSAVALLPDVGLCLVGDGEERKHLEMLADELGISDRVVMTGWVSDPTRWLAACDVSCVTSTHETLGNVVLEAWDSQIPVISTPTPGPSWLLADQKSGLLLEDFSHENLAAGIAKLRDEPALRQELVANGASKLKKEFSADAIVDAYLAAITAHNPKNHEQ